MRVVCMARGRVVGRTKRTATLKFSVETCGRLRTESSRAEPETKHVNDWYSTLSIRTTKHQTMKTYWTMDSYLNEYNKPTNAHVQSHIIMLNQHVSATPVTIIWVSYS